MLPCTLAKLVRCYNCGKLGHMCRKCKTIQHNNWINWEAENLHRGGQDLRVTSGTSNSIETKHQGNANSRSEMVGVGSGAIEQAMNNLSCFDKVERIENLLLTLSDRSKILAAHRENCGSASTKSTCFVTKCVSRPRTRTKRPYIRMIA